MATVRRFVRQFSSSCRVQKCIVGQLESLPHRIYPRYSPNGQDLYSLIWETPPRNVCVIKKPWNSAVRANTVEFIDFLSRQYPSVNVVVEPDVAEELEPDISALDHDVEIYTGNRALLPEKADLLVTLGGDGTILSAASLFANADVPPVLSFSMGTLGFLMPFDFKDAQKTFNSVYTSDGKVLNRMRLECETRYNHAYHVTTHAMNDLTIHRGMEPHLTRLDICVNDHFVTTAIADGITVATPTGSTAYSLSSGGSIVHPGVACILITPICPRSLSFRPLIFPASSKISLSVSDESRGRTAELSIDGLKKGTLSPGDRITVQSERGIDKGIWCVTPTDTDWVQRLNKLLGFNSVFGKFEDPA
uniref:ARAD1C27522p n=1 Tax=Blastobotrys adeninivorans TaxID=409370 RepID=A0A060T888_BLAAD